MRNRLEQEADSRRQIFVKGLHQGRRALAPAAVFDRMMGLAVDKVPILRRLPVAIRRYPLAALAVLGLAISSVRLLPRPETAGVAQGKKSIQRNKEKQSDNS